MLVLSRQVLEKIIISDTIIIQVIDIRGDKVRIGVEAPPGVSIDREEVYNAKQRDKARVQTGKTVNDPV